MTGLLKDEYFPAESIDYLGKLQIVPFQDVEQSKIDQFAELVLDSNGVQYILQTNGCLKDICIELGTWYSDDNFTPECTVFYASELCSSDAVMIQLDPAMTQGIRITYTSEDTVFTTDLMGILQ